MASPAAVGGCGSADVGIENDPGFVRPSCEDPYGDLVEVSRPRRRSTFSSFTWGNPADRFAQLFRRTEVLHCKRHGGLHQVGRLLGGSFHNEYGHSRDENFFLEQCIQACELGILIATRGDDVIGLDNAASVRSFLGSIDTPQEAELLLRMNGFEIRAIEAARSSSGNGFDVQAFTREGCDGLTRHVSHVTPDGMATEIDAVVLHEADPNCIVGRRPAGLRPSRSRSATAPIASYLSNAARLEAASVHAFHRLARELQLHGAPRSLVQSARRAARDEVRHTKVTIRLASSFGANQFDPPDIEPANCGHSRPSQLKMRSRGCRS